MASQDMQIAKLPLEEPLRGRWRRIVAVVGLTVLVSGPGFLLMVHDKRSKAAADVAFWRVEGPPCARLDPAVGAASRVTVGNVAYDYRGDGVHRSTATPYDGALYERRGGGMLCTHRTDPIDGVPVRYPICKFDVPDYLSVSVDGREELFDLTMGRSAAVRVVKGQVRCVVTPRFRM